MEMTGKIHVPTTQYGYIEKEYSFVGDEDFDRIMIKDFKRISDLWKSPKTDKSPTILGETMVENGHIYEASMNEATKKLYWLIKKI